VPIVFDRLVHQGRISMKRMIELLSVNPARLLKVRGGSLENGAPADLTVLAPDLAVTIDAARLVSKSKNTPVRSLEVPWRRRRDNRCRKGRVSKCARSLRRGRTYVTRQDTLRRQALKTLEDLGVLMRDGHFDYGNGFPRPRLSQSPSAVPAPVDDLAPRAGSARGSAAGDPRGHRRGGGPGRPEARCSHTRWQACSMDGAR
jgi:cytosine/adenosine deaminase-related metal-dependent hydrolase